MVVLNRWIYQNKDASLGKNILVTDDEMLPACSTQFAQHIIHFSSPANKDTILQRYEACMSAYQCQMDRMLNQRETPTNALYSIIYFDEQSDGLINILPLLSYRAKCLFPQNLIDLMNVSLITKPFKYTFLIRKKKKCLYLFRRLGIV